MALRSVTPPDSMVDPSGRPYFLWDQDLTLDEFRHSIRHDGPEVRAWLIGKLMREAKPDDVFEFVTLADIVDAWPALQPHLGRRRAFWTWILGEWGALPRG